MDRRQLLGGSVALGALGTVLTTTPALAAPSALGGGAYRLVETPGGDLWLDPADYAAVPGEVEGGVIRRATSLQIPWHYTQTAAPVDPAIGTAVNVDWQATLDDNTVWIGPQAQSGYFGPRGVFNIEGDLRYDNDLVLGITPVGYADLLGVANTPGVARRLTPGWSFMATRMYLADGAQVQLGANDTELGHGSFVDNVCYFTADGGSMVAAASLPGAWHYGFVSVPFITGAAHMAGRVGVKVEDVNGNGPVSPFQADAGQVPGWGVTIDTGDGTIDLNVGIDVVHLKRGTRNVGLRNASATVYPVQESALDAPSRQVRIDATVVVLTNTTGALITLTTAPLIPAGLEGQRLTLLADQGAAPVRLQGALDLPGSALAETITLLAGEALELVYQDAAWRPVRSTPSWVHHQTLPGTPALSIGAPASPGMSFRHSTHASGGVTVLDVKAPAGETTPVAGMRLFNHGDSTPRTALTQGGLAFTDGSNGAAGSYLTRAGTGVVTLSDFSGTPQTLEVGRLRLRSVASLPAGPNVVGDMVVHSGKVKVCTVAGSPGTWVVVGAQT